MTALWAPSSNGNGYGYSNGRGDGNGGGWIDNSSGNRSGDGCGWSNGRGDGDGDSRGDGYSDGDGYPEQDYDGQPAIGRLGVYEAMLPVSDLLTLAVTR